MSLDQCDRWWSDAEGRSDEITLENVVVHHNWWRIDPDGILLHELPTAVTESNRLHRRWRIDGFTPDISENRIIENEVLHFHCWWESFSLQRPAESDIVEKNIFSDDVIHIHRLHHQLIYVLDSDISNAFQSSCFTYFDIVYRMDVQILQFHIQSTVKPKRATIGYLQRVGRRWEFHTVVNENLQSWQQNRSIIIETRPNSTIRTEYFRLVQSQLTRVWSPSSLQEQPALSQIKPGWTDWTMAKRWRTSKDDFMVTTSLNALLEIITVRFLIEIYRRISCVYACVQLPFHRSTTKLRCRNSWRLEFLNGK